MNLQAGSRSAPSRLPRRHAPVAHQQVGQFLRRKLQARGIDVAKEPDALDVGRQVGERHAPLVEQPERQQRP